MNLLILTQKVDILDSGVLGFFCSWIEEFSKNAQNVTVVCLEEGTHSLPQNVKVYSLGKEKRRSRLMYVKNFYKYIFRERKNYDVVFVHMNQEYVLLGGIFWRFFGKKILFWRNHSYGNILTRIAVLLSHKVFCTSSDSFTAKFKKTQVSPTGINISKFLVKQNVTRTPRSILSLGRISKVKQIDIFASALIDLHSQGVDFSATIVGDPEADGKEYYDSLVDMLSDLIKIEKVSFKPALPNTKTPEAYQSHELFVNMTNSGSLDKTIFSSMVSEMLPVVCNSYFQDVLPENFVFKEGDAKDLANKIKIVLDLPQAEKNKITESMKKYVIDKHSLEATIKFVLADFKKKG